MRSAYVALGIPGDASQEEIESAFRRVEAQFPRERLAQEEGALARLGEIRSAYNVLKDPELRAAHDRKLQAAVRPPVRPRTVVVTEEPSPMRKVLVVGVWVLAAVLASGAYITHRNAETRRIAVAEEEAARKAQERDAEERRAEQARQVAERARLAAQAAVNERRLEIDAQYAASRVTANLRAQEAATAHAQRMELAEAQRRENMRLNEERRATAEARQRIERDKQRVREVCFQVYRRPDC